MKFTTDQINVLVDNIKKHKVDSVHVKMIEEMSELTKEICKSLLPTGGDKAKTIDEIAYVYVVLKQMELLYGKEAIQEIIDFKIERLSFRNKFKKVKS